MNFKDLHFGKICAEDEAREEPLLLKNCFFDSENRIENLISKKKSLILGYKGSGKTAIYEHLRLNNAYNLQIVNLTIADFPYNNLKTVVSEEASASKFPLAWSWLLLLQIISQVNNDQSSGVQYNETFQASKRTLDKLGLSQNLELKDLVLYSGKKHFKAALGKALELEFSSDYKRTSAIHFFVQKLKLALKGVTSKGKHIILIDGVDEIIVRNTFEYEIIAGLVKETNELNNYFSVNNIPVSIVVFCRTDIFDKLPLANKNKIRLGSCININWYENYVGNAESELVKLINFRCSKQASKKIDIAKLLPSKIYDKDTVHELLDHTRYTPRDFVMLLSSIQQCVKGNVVKEPEVIDGLKCYSIDYFLNEIKDELTGHIKDTGGEALIQALGSNRVREISYKGMCEIFAEGPLLKKQNANEILTTLYECGAIGNIGKRGRETIFSYKYKNRNSVFSPKLNLILHKGTWKALNVG